MTGTRTELPATSELVEGLLFYPIAFVISSTIAPGLTLCIPGLLFVTVLILVPIVALAVVVVALAAVVAAPVFLVRAIRGRGWRRAASTSPSRVAVPSTSLARPLTALSADRSRSSLVS
jgi:hypothetical protein